MKRHSTIAQRILQKIRKKYPKGHEIVSQHFVVEISELISEHADTLASSAHDDLKNRLIDLFKSVNNRKVAAREFCSLIRSLFEEFEDTAASSATRQIENDLRQ